MFYFYNETRDALYNLGVWQDIAWFFAWFFYELYLNYSHIFPSNEGIQGYNRPKAYRILRIASRFWISDRRGERKCFVF